MDAEQYLEPDVLNHLFQPYAAAVRRIHEVVIGKGISDVDRDSPDIQSSHSVRRLTVWPSMASRTGTSQTRAACPANTSIWLTSLNTPTFKRL